MNWPTAFVGLFLALVPVTAKAAYIFSFSQTATGVLETGSGSLTVSGDVFAGESGEGYVYPAGPEVGVGDSGGTDLYFVYFDSYQSIGQGTSYAYADDTTGPLVAFGGQRIYVPVGFTSGVLPTSTAFFEGQTFESLGLTPGNYLYHFTPQPSAFDLAAVRSLVDTDGPNTIIVRVVPLPASAPMIGASLLGLAGFAYVNKRRKAAVTT